MLGGRVEGSGWLLWFILRRSLPLLYSSYAGIHIKPAHHRFLPLFTAVCQGFPGLPCIRRPCILGTCADAAIGHGGLNGACFPVHIYSAPANVTSVFGPRSPVPDVLEQFSHHERKGRPAVASLLVADNVRAICCLIVWNWVV